MRKEENKDFIENEYKILAYLYKQLKNGAPIDPDMLMYDGGLFQINRTYWVYIFTNLLEQNDTAKMEYRITQLDIEMKKIKGLLEEVVPEKGASHSKSLM